VVSNNIFDRCRPINAKDSVISTSARKIDFDDILFGRICIQRYGIERQLYRVSLCTLCTFCNAKYYDRCTTPQGRYDV